MPAAKKKPTVREAVTLDTIGLIADRAVALYAEFGQRVKRNDIIMDITMCHMRAMSLDLDALLAADKADFAHDIGGINRHLDHDTLQLTDGFVPRYARNQ